MPRPHPRCVVGLHQDPPPAGPEDGLADAGVVHPVRHAPDVLRQERGAPVDELGELVDLVQHAGVLQLREPLRRGDVVAPELELHIQDRVGEPRDLVVRQGFLGVAVPLLPALGCTSMAREEFSVTQELQTTTHALPGVSLTWVSYPRSEIRHRFVSRETLTVASNGVCDAVHMYFVRIVSTSCFL